MLGLIKDQEKGVECIRYLDFKTLVDESGKEYTVESLKKNPPKENKYFYYKKAKISLEQFKAWQKGEEKIKDIVKKHDFE